MARRNRVAVCVERGLKVACQVADWPVMVAQQAKAEVLQEIARVWRRERTSLLGPSNVVHVALGQREVGRRHNVVAVEVAVYQLACQISALGTNSDNQLAAVAAPKLARLPSWMRRGAQGLVSAGGGLGGLLCQRADAVLTSLLVLFGKVSVAAKEPRTWIRVGVRARVRVIAWLSFGFGLGFGGMWLESDAPDVRKPSSHLPIGKGMGVSSLCSN